MIRKIIKILNKSFSTMLTIFGVWTSACYKDEKSSYMLMMLSVWILLDNVLLPLANYIDEEEKDDQ